MIKLLALFILAVGIGAASAQSTGYTPLARVQPQLFNSDDPMPYTPVACIDNKLPLLERSLPPADIAYMPFYFPLGPYERGWFEREREELKTEMNEQNQCYMRGITALLEADYDATCADLQNPKLLLQLRAHQRRSRYARWALLEVRACREHGMLPQVP